MTLGKILSNRSVYFSILGLLTGAVMISLSGIWVKVSQVTPTVSAFYRVFSGGIILLSAALYRREIKWIGSRHLLQGLICGLLFTLDLSLYHYSIHYVSPGLATILPNMQSSLAVGALGIFSQSFGWILITNALPHIRTSLSGLILLLQPALAFVWDVLFFQRQTRLLNWFGVVIVLVAIYLGALKSLNSKLKRRLKWQNSYSF
jgi:drug/metabolite transporter (DMT)-like permease